MWRSKSCPKCRGDVFVELDITDGEWYEYCLQCSYRHYLPPIAKPAPRKELVGATTERRRRRKRGARPERTRNQKEPQESAYPRQNAFLRSGEGGELLEAI